MTPDRPERPAYELLLDARLHLMLSIIVNVILLGIVFAMASRKC